MSYVRMELKLSLGSKRRLDALMAEQEASSYGEVIGEALRLYEHCVGTLKLGGDVLIRNPSGELVSYFTVDPKQSDDRTNASEGTP